MYANSPLPLSSISNAPVSEDSNPPHTRWVSLTPPQFLTECYFDKNVFYCIRVILVWWIFGMKFWNHQYCLRLTPKRGQVQYTYILFSEFTLELKPFGHLSALFMFSYENTFLKN